MVRHSLIAYRDDSAAAVRLPSSHGRLAQLHANSLPETIRVQERLPAGAAAVLINREHTDTDLYLPVDATELRLVKRKSSGQAFHWRRCSSDLPRCVP